MVMEGRPRHEMKPGQIESELDLASMGYIILSCLTLALGRIEWGQSSHGRTTAVLAVLCVHCISPVVSLLSSLAD